jgi:hypothetical protein
MSFEFQNLTKAKLNSVNVRSERHGQELVPAVDLKITINTSNNILDGFDVGLKPSLYFKAQDDEQETLEGIDPITSLPNLRFPKLVGPLKWDTVGSGYVVTIDWGMGGDSNIVMHSCEINGLTFSPKEGGTVELTVRVQISGVDEAIIGKLAMLIQHEIYTTMTAPTPADVDDLIKPMENPFFNTDPAPLTPEAAFIGSVH